MGYDFSKLPKKKHRSAIRMVNEKDLFGLLYLHDTYRLSDFNYSCCGMNGLLEWFKDAIENGEISTD